MTLASQCRPVPLACGHPDDDPTVWHHSDDLDHEPVCSACCTLCTRELEVDHPAEVAS